MTDTEKTKLIIDRSRLVSRPKRVLAGGVTAFFWFVWIYLWLPLITLVAWALGFRSAYIQLKPSIEAADAANIAITYFAIIVCLGIALLTWAFSEYLRFKNVRRRVHPQAVSVFELARYAQVNTALLVQWQLARRVVAYHGSNAQFHTADVIS